LKRLDKRPCAPLGEVAREATARGELADIAVKVRVGGVEPIAVARLSMEMK
jgi:hypothetical protein